MYTMLEKKRIFCVWWKIDYNNVREISVFIFNILSIILINRWLITTLKRFISHVLAVVSIMGRLSHSTLAGSYARRPYVSARLSRGSQQKTLIRPITVRRAVHCRSPYMLAARPPLHHTDPKIVRYMNDSTLSCDIQMQFLVKNSDEIAWSSHFVRC